MESEVMKKFNSELSSIHESKVPSKTKIQDITRAALKAKSLYKHVVFSIEKFLSKCKPEHRLHVLYIIDSIIRASKHQFKEKDVFAPRFLKCFEKILKVLLLSKSEQMRVIRTLNLWLANGVYTKEEIEPFREQCRKAGVETDFELVEKAVKGETADMRIYGGSYIKKHKSATQRSATPPLPPQDGLLGAGPPQQQQSSLFKFKPSEEIVEGTISQKEMLTMIEQFDTTGIFGKNADLLEKAHRTFVDCLIPRIFVQNQQFEQARQLKKSSIKNVLTKDFEYSDDEDEKEKEAEEEELPVCMTHEQVLVMAEELMKNPDVLQALKTMAEEKIMEFNNASNLIRSQVAAASQSNNLPPPVSTHQTSGIMGLPGQPNLAALQHINPAVLQGINPQLLQGAAQMNPAAIQALQSGRLPQLGPNAINLAQFGALRGVAGSQPPHQGNLLNFIGNPLLTLGGLGLQPSNDLVKQLQQQGAQFGVPPPMVHQQQQQQQPQPPLPQPNDLMAQQQQLQFLENELEQGGSVGKDDSKRDNKRQRERERSKERERRKMGLPSLKPGTTYIASRTLWLKKVPQNCTENDLKIAVESCGETAGIRIIQSRACAFVTMETRKSAYDVINRLKEVTIAKKEFKVYWARLQGLTDERLLDKFDSERGVIGIPHDQLPPNLEKLCEGAWLDLDTLPDDKKGLYKETGELKMSIPPPTTVRQPPIPGGMPPGIPPHFQFGGLPLTQLPGGNMPPPPGSFPPGLGLPPPHPPKGPPPPPGTQFGAYHQPLPPGVAPPPGTFDPNKPPPLGGRGPLSSISQQPPPPPSTHHQHVYGGGPPPPPGTMTSASPYGQGGGGPRGGFRGGFRGGRGGGYNRHDGGPGRFEDRRDGGWQQRDRDRSGVDRRSGTGSMGGGGSGRFEEDRRRSSRWGGREEERDDGGRRERDRRRDRDGSTERRSNKDVRRTPPHPEDHGGEGVANKEEAKGSANAAPATSAPDDETVSSTTLDDIKTPATEAKETKSSTTEKTSETTIKVDGVRIDAAQENSEEVPMDLE